MIDPASCILRVALSSRARARCSCRPAGKIQNREIPSFQRMPHPCPLTEESVPAMAGTRPFAMTDWHWRQCRTILRRANSEGESARRWYEEIGERQSNRGGGCQHGRPRAAAVGPMRGPQASTSRPARQRFRAAGTAGMGDGFRSSITIPSPITTMLIRIT